MVLPDSKVLARVLGIDPGTRMAGYGIIDLLASGRPIAVAAGVWRLETPQRADLSARLSALALEFRHIVALYTPTHMCLEQSFLADNPRTALFLGHARGVVLSEAAQSGLVISELAPTSAKKTITGHGRAGKAEVARMMSSLLGFTPSVLPYDATDALALAYAAALRLCEKQRLEKKSDLPMAPAGFAPGKDMGCFATQAENFLLWQKSEKKRRRKVFLKPF